MARSYRNIVNHIPKKTKKKHFNTAVIDVAFPPKIPVSTSKGVVRAGCGKPFATFWELGNQCGITTA